jgi:RimJ/RimL family protein N-acetyltransferase
MLTKPHFHFPDIPYSNDDSPFVDERFKHYDTALQYANDLAKYGRSSPKHGSQDWLFKWRGDYAGILHLYDRSLETFGENNKRSWIGFATTPSLRQKGITKKAVCHFLSYIQDFYPDILYIHAMTIKGNITAEALLYSIGFKKDDEERNSKRHNFYLLEKKFNAG